MQLLQKFVFLAERILARDDSPEGYRYESLRLQKLFSLTTLEWRGMAEAAAVPFYEKALDSAVMQAKPVSAAQLAAVRDSLGITEAGANGMHADVFGKCAASMLESGSFAASDKERLSTVQALLAMDSSFTSKTLQSLTSPLYSSTFSEVLAEVGGLDGDADDSMCARQSGKLALRQQELLLEASDAHAIEAEALRAKSKESLAEAVKFLRAQNVPQGLEVVRKLVSFCERLSGFMVSIDHAEGPAEAALPRLFGGLKGEMKQSEVLALYRVLLLHYLEDLKIDEEEARSLARLRAVLDLSEAESTSVYQAAAGPLFRKAVQKAVEGDALGASQKDELSESLSNLALPAEVTAAISVEVYTTKLRGFAGEGKIMNEEQAGQLATLRGFLDIQMEQVYDAHAEVCSPAYRNSVREVMGVTGIIPDEYWDGLQKLRDRLGLSEEAAQGLFAVEVTQKMKEFGTKAVDAMQEKMAQQQGQAPSGDDPYVDGTGSLGIEAGAASSLSTEVLNLIDFAVAAKALVTKEAAGKEFEVCGANLRNEFSERTLKEVYKQYLIEAFSGSNAARNQRLFDNLNRLALVLGLESKEVMAIHNEIGSYIYRSYISRALQKGPLGQEETQFLSSIKEALGMEQEKCDELVREQQLNRVSVLIEQMFEKSAVVAEDVRAMRDTADLYDVDLEADLQVSTFKLERLFLCELEDMVDSGELKPDDMGALIELCEPLKISEEVAQRKLEETVQKRTSGGVLQAGAALRQDNSDDACAELERVLKFAALLPETSADAKAVSESERSELYMLYQASQLTAGAVTDESTAKLELLKSVLGLAAAASTPA